MVRTQVLKHLPGAEKGNRGGSKGDVKGRATARGAMKKGGCVRVIEGRRSEEMTQSNTSSPRGQFNLITTDSFEDKFCHFVINDPFLIKSAEIVGLWLK